MYLQTFFTPAMALHHHEGEPGRLGNPTELSGRADELNMDFRARISQTRDTHSAEGNQGGDQEVIVYCNGKLIF